MIMHILDKRHGNFEFKKNLKKKENYNLDLYRDGLSLTGMYSYSDGFFRRTVHYAADEGGYRVTK